MTEAVVAVSTGAFAEHGLEPIGCGSAWPATRHRRPSPGAPASYTGERPVELGFRDGKRVDTWHAAPASRRPREPKPGWPL